jgi:hypothetical protein
VYEQKIHGIQQHDEVRYMLLCAAMCCYALLCAAC